MKPIENLTAWRVFVAVAAEGSVSKAALRLDLDLGLASRSLIALEKSLGTTLFDRARRPFVPTLAGTRLLPAAKALLDSHERLCKAALGMRTRHIRVSLPTNMRRTPLFDDLDAYRTIDPTLDIEFVNDKDHLDVLAAGVDIAMIPYRPASTEGLVLLDAGKSNNLLLCSPGYLARHPTPKRPADLRHHTLICRNNRVYPVTTELFRGEESAPLVGAQLRYMDAVSGKEATLAGQGIAIDISANYCERELDEGQLVPVLPGWHRKTWEITVALRAESAADTQLFPFARWFAARRKATNDQAWVRLYRKFGIAF